ncbi:TonB family protein [bacterium]|nr:TonB family protein [bacterium]
MKKLFALLLLLACFNQMQAQKTKTIKTGEADNYEKYEVLSSDANTKHGRYEKYENKRLTVAGNYENGNKAGQWKYYRYDRLEKTIDYLDNGVEVATYIGGFVRTTTYLSDEMKVKNGPFTEYIDDKPHTIGHYKNDEKDGLWQLYKDGYIFYEATYSQGVVQKDTYNSGDSLLETTNYLNGKKHGECFTKYSNGNLKEQATYSNGQFDGEYKTFSKNGVALISANYDKGKRQGKREMRYRNGNLKLVSNYNNHYLDGAQKIYNRNGQLMLEITFEQGKPQTVLQANNADGMPNNNINLKEGTGNFIIYYNNGKPQYEFNLKNGQLHGVQKGYFATGAVHFIETFEEGQVEGQVESYKEDGKLNGKGLVKSNLKAGDWFYYNYNDNGVESKTISVDDSITYLANANFFEVFSFYDKAQEFHAAEQMPEFPGGMSQLSRFLQQSVVYPEMEKQNDIQGESYVQFVIDESGFITNVRIYPGMESKGTQNMHNEAMRVIQLMPRWSPGIQRGKPVKVSYSIPVRFKLR